MGKRGAGGGKGELCGSRKGCLSGRKGKGSDECATVESSGLADELALGQEKGIKEREESDVAPGFWSMELGQC